MKVKDIILCGLQDLKAHKRKNRISFMLIFLSIVVYVGVNSTMEGVKRGAYDSVNGPQTRLLYYRDFNKDSLEYYERDVHAEAEEAYSYISELFGNDERVKDIFPGWITGKHAFWVDTEKILGVDQTTVFFATYYDEILEYGYKGEKRTPEYNEIILPRYMFNIGVYTEYSYADGDELIGKKVRFESKWTDEIMELEVIGTFDNIAFNSYLPDFYCNPDFVQDYMDKWNVYAEENGYGYSATIPIYILLEKGYDSEAVWKEFVEIIGKDKNTEYGDSYIQKYVLLSEDVEGYNNYIISIGNMISFMLLFIAIVNIMISSISEVKYRNWEFALKVSMGYKRNDLVKIFAVEKIANVIKALLVAIVILLLYSGVVTYYYRNLEIYWKRGYMITIEMGDVFVAMVLAVIAALMGVVLARFFIGNIDIAKSLKSEE